ASLVVVSDSFFLTSSTADFCTLSLHDALPICSQNVHIKNVTIDFSGEDALYARDLPYLTIENSTASYSSNSGFNVLQNTPNAKISNNRITNTNVFPGLGKSGIGSGYGIEVASDNSLVEYNEIINTGYL